MIKIPKDICFSIRISEKDMLRPFTKTNTSKVKFDTNEMKFDTSEVKINTNEVETADNTKKTTTTKRRNWKNWRQWNKRKKNCHYPSYKFLQECRDLLLSLVWYLENRASVIPIGTVYFHGFGDFGDFETEEFYCFVGFHDTFTVHENANGEIRVSCEFTIRKATFWKAIYYSRDSGILSKIIKYFPFGTNKMFSEFFPWYFIAKNPIWGFWDIRHKIHVEKNRVCRHRQYLKRNGHYERGGHDVNTYEKISKRMLSEILRLYSSEIDWEELTVIIPFGVIEMTWGAVGFHWKSNSFSWRKIPISFMREKRITINPEDTMYFTSFYTLDEICQNPDMNWDLNCLGYFRNRSRNRIRVNSIFYTRSVIYTKQLNEEIEEVYHEILKWVKIDKRVFHEIISYLFTTD